MGGRFAFIFANVRRGPLHYLEQNRFPTVRTSKYEAIGNAALHSPLSPLLDNGPVEPAMSDKDSARFVKWDAQVSLADVALQFIAVIPIRISPTAEPVGVA